MANPNRHNQNVSTRDVGNQIKDEAISTIDRLKEKGTHVRDSAATSLDNVADRFANKNYKNKSIQKVSENVSQKLHDAGKYIRTHEFKVMGEDLRKSVQKHPLKSAACAVGLGYLIGKLRSRGHSKEA